MSLTWTLTAGDLLPRETGADRTTRAPQDPNRSTMAQDLKTLVEPNTYEVSGDGTQISYSTSGNRRLAELLLPRPQRRRPDLLGRRHSIRSTPRSTPR